MEPIFLKPLIVSSQLLIEKTPIQWGDMYVYLNPRLCGDTWIESIQADVEATSDLLKPFTISQIASTNSFNTIGSLKISISEISPVASKRLTATKSMEPITPQTDNQRGTSLD